MSDDEREPFEPAVIRVIESLKPGDLISYGEIAAEAGYPGAARAVGRVLKVTDGMNNLEDI